MSKHQVGKVSAIFDLTPVGKGIAVSMRLSEPISIGDKITFDGWQEGIVYNVDNLTQNHKKVASAAPGLAAVTLPYPVAMGSNVYKIVEDEAPQANQSDDQGAANASQHTQADAGGVIPIVLGTAAAGSAQTQNQAPENAAPQQSQQPQQSVSAIQGNFSVKGMFAGPRFSSAGSNLMQQINLAATSTEFLQYSPKYVANIKAKSMSYWLWYTIVFLVLIVPLGIVGEAYQNSNPPTSLVLITLFAELLVAGGILMYIGFKEFSLEQTLSSTPVSKIHIATYGLNKMQGKFAPHNAQPLKSPISGAECAYYSIGIYAAFWQSSGRSRYLVVEPVGAIGKGVPTLFADDSGYLAIDMIKAPNLEVISNAFEINKRGIGAALVREISGGIAYITQGKQLANELLPKITDAANSNSTVDLSQLQGFNIKPYFSNRIIDFKGKLTNYFHLNALQNFAFFLLEQYIPVNSDYTCLGAAADINKSIEGKPVKVLVPEQQRGIMAVKAGQAQNATKGIGKRTIINLAIGVIFAIAAFYVLSVYIGMPSAASTNVVTSLATTTVLPSQPSAGQLSTTTPSTTVPQAAGALSAQGSCNGFSISEAAFSTAENSSCSWNGGNVTIYAGGGNSGYVSVNIVGADGKTYFSKGTNNWCSAQIGSVYLPPQNYTISIMSGRGGGACSTNPNAVVSISAS
ncbi:MAG: hypothetical protein ACP5K9_00485 [Candidatus Micrarchaeia archaeon]